MSRFKRRVARIKEEISIIAVLGHFGYRVRTDGEDREQQFRCDLHGDGNDGAPSARAYPESNSYYCFGCSKVRDSLQLVVDKSGCSFKEAVDFLEKTFDLPTLPWEDDDKFSTKEKKRVDSAVRQNLNYSHSGDIVREKRRAESLLSGLSLRELKLSSLVRYWNAYDGLAWNLSQGRITDETCCQALAALREKIILEVKSSA